MGAGATSSGARKDAQIAPTAAKLSRSLLDAGVFIAAAHDDRGVAALLKARAGKSMLYVAAHTIAEFHREGGTSAKQSLLARQWRLEFISITAAEGELAGALLGRTGGNNSMDALIVAVASRGRFDELLTSDPDDLERLRENLRAPEWNSFAVVDIR